MSWFTTDVNTSVMKCFLLAGLATILRPTNVLIWAVIGLYTVRRAYEAELFAMARQGATAG